MIGLCSGHVGSLSPANETRGTTLVQWGDDAPAERIRLPPIRGTTGRAVSARLQAFLRVLARMQSLAEQAQQPWAPRIGVLRYILQTYVVGGIPLTTTSTLRLATSGDDEVPIPTLRSQERESIMREVRAATGVPGLRGVERRLRALIRLARFAGQTATQAEIVNAMEQYALRGRPFG